MTLEMERDCMIAQGAAYFLHDSWMERCDKWMMYVCAVCGIICVANRETQKRWCKACGQENAKFIKTYYISKLLTQQLYGMGIAFRFLTQANAPLELPKGHNANTQKIKEKYIDDVKKITKDMSTLSVDEK